MAESNVKISPVNMEERRALELCAGDTVRVWQKIKEGDKSRLQAFEGMILSRKHGQEPGATFTVRRMIDGIGVERIFPLYSSAIDKIEVLKKSTRVRRAKLYFIRRKAAKEIRKRMKSERVAPAERRQSSEENSEPKEAEVAAASNDSDSPEKFE